MNLLKIFATFTLLATMIGCASTPENNPQLETLQSQYQQLERNADVNKYAALELQQAHTAITKVAKAIQKDARTDVLNHTIYVAEKKLAIVRSTTEMKQADAVINQAELTRKDILLEAKTEEATKAQLRADLANAKAARAEAYAQQMEQRAQRLETDIKEITTQQTERGLILTLGSILFEVDKAELQPGAERTLMKVSQFLNQYPQNAIKIEGFTDNTGEDSYNQQLSERRAQAVKTMLTIHGVKPERIKVEGLGESFPVANNDTRAGRQQNRRVEVILANDENQSISQR